jgi:hypothetical protein
VVASIYDADMKPTKRFKLFADFGQIHVCDPMGAGSLEEAWTPGASEDRIADGGDIVGIGAKESDDVEVSVEICASAPERDAAAWDHVTESSIDVASGELAVLGCTDELRKARRFPVKAGVWRVRASHANLAEGREWIRLQIWASRRRSPRVVKRWSPPPKAQPKAGKRIASAKQAVRAALRGETDAALAFLLPRAKDGDFDASATTLQLLAFRGQWRELVPLAMNVIAKKPDADATRRTCCAACDLLWRASVELEDPSIIEAAAAKLVRTMKSEASPRLHGERKLPKKPTTEDRRRFVELANDPKFEKRYRGKPHHRAAHLMAYARLHLGLEDETLTLWDPENEQLGFDDAVWVAEVHARRGDTRRAWETLESRLHRWWPLTIWDVAPVSLLVNPSLAPLMTSQRCEQVLSTVRGDEAE